MKIAKVVVFCGAQSPNKKDLKLAYDMGTKLAQHKYITVTGGGTGMMEQVNKGAHDAGGESHGISVDSTIIEPMNGYLNYSKRYKTFTARHDALLSYGDAYVALPGGLGTVLEIVDITQKKKFRDVDPERPLILVGEFYDKLHHVFQQIAHKGYIKEKLQTFYMCTPDVEGAIKLLSLHDK